MNQVSSEDNYPSQTEIYPRCFYKVLQNIATGSQQEINIRHYTMNMIPNDLKYNTYEKDLTVFLISSCEVYQLASLMQPIAKDKHDQEKRINSIFVHALNQPITFILNQQTWTIPEKTSYEFTIDNLSSYHETSILVNKTPLRLSVETQYLDSFPYLTTIPNNPVKSLVSVSEHDLNQRVSFLRQALTPNEIRNKILFIDTKMATDKQGQYHALSVAVMNYEGQILMDEFVTPRVRITDCESRIHGIYKNSIQGKMDEEELLVKLQEKFYGSILVGHGMDNVIKALKIRVNELVGIRDLAAGICLAKHILYSRKQFFRLDTLAKVICGIAIPKVCHPAREVVSAIRAIYRQVEEEWRDHIHPTDQFKEPDLPTFSFSPSVTTELWIREQSKKAGNWLVGAARERWKELKRQETFAGETKERLELFKIPLKPVEKKGKRKGTSISRTEPSKRPGYENENVPSDLRAEETGEEIVIVISKPEDEIEQLPTIAIVPHTQHIQNPEKSIPKESTAEVQKGPTRDGEYIDI